MDKMILIAGPCALEERDTAMQIAERIRELSALHNFHFIFKASYRKANRSRIDSFTGIGDEEALNIISEIGKELDVPTITDIHESHEADLAAKYVDNLQIPAFLCRQTDLLVAAAKTGKGVNIKKGQFLSPEAMQFSVQKIKDSGNDNVWVCERGSSFGYNDLIVDATSIHRLKKHGVPVIMDCTHAVQKPNQTSGVTGGDPSLIESIALSATATGADGLFMETHPNPESAKSDPYTMLPLEKLEGILEKVSRIRQALYEFAK